ncbi:hypothetical protein COO91_06968 [Nostoc flagelliforme CCNUN1]|uniref:Uncharacterized protein n=1 Tax=Nostoc flagelliforme CCNUN1 TaxID=2038116 RepID=A0A2K8SZR9_9NOSO|nr:hypothetical protein COO91_06968 [Nostoc flagelliforme CCNUN1]
MVIGQELLAIGQRTNDKSGRYTQQFVQHEHFYFLQFDTNIFSL